MEHILVATDGSEPSLRAVDRAVQLAKDLGSKLTIINVFEVKPAGEAVQQFAEAELSGGSTPAPGPVTVPTALGLDVLTAIEETHGHWRAVSRLVSDRLLHTARRSAEAAGLADVQTISEEGNPAVQIVSTARSVGADLIVVGRRGLGELTELLLGTVAQKVLHHAQTDVLVVQ